MWVDTSENVTGIIEVRDDSGQDQSESSGNGEKGIREMIRRQNKQAEYSRKGEGSSCPQREPPKKRPFFPGRGEVRLNLGSLGFYFRRYILLGCHAFLCTFPIF